MTYPNDPAFASDTLPKEVGTAETYNLRCRGLSKREYFAAMAMQGILSSREIQVSATYKMDKQWTAGEALAHADALIAELNKDGK